MEVGQAGMAKEAGAGLGQEGCVGSEGGASAAPPGRGSEGVGRGRSTGPSDMEGEVEHTIGVTGEMGTPGMS